MITRLLAGCAVALWAAACAPSTAGRTESVTAVLRERVAETEMAFARTMADRDSAGFAAYIADDAVFLNGGRPLRGRRAVLEHWGPFFAGPAAPFSWKSDLAEVNGTGTLAQSIGSVFSPDGRLIARFYSTWRREDDGSWKIVFDNGYDVCKDSL